MCTVPPVTEKNLGRPADVVGLECPLCEGGSVLGYMKFLDPHGVERVDPDLFECASRRHSFMLGGGALRLLAADGARSRERRLFQREGDAWREAPAPAPSTQ